MNCLLKGHVIYIKMTRYISSGQPRELFVFAEKNCLG